MADAPLTHIGFIADGNRRWARSRGLPTLEGHRRGFNKVELIIDELKDTEVKYVSFFLFSTENWGRSPEEVAYLMDLVRSKIDQLTKRYAKENVRIASTTVVNGKLPMLPPGRLLPAKPHSPPKPSANISIIPKSPT